MIFLTFVTGVLLLMAACSENFLTPEPRSFFAPENVYVDRAGFEALLVTMQRDLVSEATGQHNPFAVQWKASEAAVSAYNQDFNQLLLPSGQSGWGGGSWVLPINNWFEYIKNANVVISRIDDIEWEDQQARNEILAEALWHRSYWYYRMIHTYGEVPFVGEEILSARVDFNTHSRWAILDKLQEDMEYSVQHIAESGLPGQPTRGAANHLLAKIALANLDFVTAEEAANRVINGPYALMTERFGQDANDPVRNIKWDLHRHMNKNLPENTETLLAFVDRYDAPSEARSSGTFTMRDYHPTWWATWMGKDSEGGRGMIDSGAMYDSLGRGNPNVYFSDWHSYRIWEEDGYTWEDTPDLRRADINWVDREEYFYNNPNSPDYGQPFDPNNMDRPGQYWATMYPVPFYKTYAPKHPDQPPFFHGSNGDMYIYRLAETYLLRAEAHYWQDNLAAAADDINTVRARAQAPLISAGDVTLDYIFDERARELVIEEPRQNELVRASYILAALNRNGYSLDTIHDNNWWYDRVSNLNDYYIRTMDPPMPVGIEPHHFLFPIHVDLIDENTLGRINQTPGYPGSENNVPPLDTID